MAISKSFTMAQQYVANATAPTSATFTCEPVVENGQLVPGDQRIRPGVFTAGTPSEGTSSNPNRDSNA